MKTQSSELQRVAEERARNAARLIAWQFRKQAHRGAQRSGRSLVFPLLIERVR